MITKKQLLKKYLFNILISFDQFVNTLFGGDPDETISSRIAKNQSNPFFKALGFIIELVDKGHLKRTLEADEGKDAISAVIKKNK